MLQGVGFQVISIGILYIILLNFLIDVFSVEVLFLIINISFILTIISGGIAAYLSRSRNYLDGIINGLLVGLICVILLGSFRDGIFAFLIFFIYGGIFMSGGAIGILIRRRFTRQY